MVQAAPVRPKIPTESPQLSLIGVSRPPQPKGRASRAAPSQPFVGATGRAATRGDGRPVVELEYGITVYPGRWVGGPVAGGVV